MLAWEQGGRLRKGEGLVVAVCIPQNIDIFTFNAKIEMLMLSVRVTFPLN